MATTTFAANGTLQFFTVPAGITRLYYELAGGVGASFQSTDIDAPDVQAPGKGAVITGYLDVDPGETLWIALGAAGSRSFTENGTGNAGGFGQGGANGGGAASAIGRGEPSLANALVVAGGGGGGGEDGIGGSGGGIGGRSQGSGGGGRGGGQDPTYSATAGESTSTDGCGGGGGGVIGGRAGTIANDRRGGGGGGSSKVPPGATVRSTHGARGQATLTWGFPPGQPIIEAPVPGEPVAAGRDVVLRHRYVGSSAGDAQTSAVVTYTTPTGTVTVELEGDATEVVVPALQATAGVLTWSVVTRGQGGASSAAAAASAPLAPAQPPPGITAPAADTTITGARLTVSWTAPEQVAYRVRRRSADGSVVYAVITTPDPAARGAVLVLDTTGRAELVDVEVQGANRVWSSPATVRIGIEWTRPPVPSVALAPDPDRGALLVEVRRTGGTAPATTTYEAIEIATGARSRADVDEVGRWWTPASGVEYAVAVTDVDALGVPATGISPVTDLGWGRGLWGAAPWGSPRP